MSQVPAETFTKARELLERAGMDSRTVAQFGDDIVLSVLDGVFEIVDEKAPDANWLKDFYRLSEWHMVCVRGEGWCDPSEVSEGDAIIDEVCRPIDA